MNDNNYRLNNKHAVKCGYYYLYLVLFFVFLFLDNRSHPSSLFLFVATLLVTALVVFVERGQRKITVNYAKRQVGNKVYGGQSTYLPLKLNMAGVIPPIFASSIILFPATLAGWFGSSDKMYWLKNHIGRMTGAYVAALTAFLVVNNTFLPDV